MGQGPLSKPVVHWWLSLNSSWAAPWMRRERRWRGCLRRGAFLGLERGGAVAAATHHGGAAAAATAAPGVDPHSFGHGRAADEITTRVEADALYDIFNPTDFVKEWTVKEVGRVADALVGLSLPFDSCNIAPTLTALDRAVFNAPVALTPTLDLVAADVVTQGNGGFAMFGDVNDSLDYHLWALAFLMMGLRYKPRPMHTPDGYDVSGFYSLR